MRGKRSERTKSDDPKGRSPYPRAGSKSMRDSDAQIFVLANVPDEVSLLTSGAEVEHAASVTEVTQARD